MGLLRFYAAYVSPRTAGLKAALTVGVLAAALAGGAALFRWLGVDWRVYAAFAGFLVGLLTGVIVVATVPTSGKALGAGVAGGMLLESAARLGDPGSLTDRIGQTSLARLARLVLDLAAATKSATTDIGIAASSAAIASGIWTLVITAFAVVAVSSLYVTVRRHG